MGNLSLDIGLQSLLTAQANLDVIGHNVANASTPGYSRQSLLTSTAPGMRLRGLILGRGVQADVVQRTVDTLIQGRILRQSGSLGRLDARLQGLADAELFLGATGESGIPARLAGFFSGLSTLSTSPGDPLLRAGAVQSAAHLAGGLNTLATDLEGLRRDALTALETTVTQVNSLAQRIGDVNRRIPELQHGVAMANDLLDQRDEAVRQLSELADVRVVEEPTGTTRVLIGGHTLVGQSGVNTLHLDQDPVLGNASLRLGVGGPLIAIDGGRLGGLAQLVDVELPALADELDGFASGLALETGRIHSTGLPASGPFRVLKGTHSVVDVDGSGTLGNELLADSGLPFDVASGTLYVTMTNEQTGAIEKHVVTIDAKRTSVDGFLADLDAIDGLNARLDSKGLVRLFSDPGKAFDFSPRLDPDPDAAGTFGGGRASLGTGPGPFALSPGATLDLNTPTGPLTVTFDPQDFQQIGQATADELAAVLNADPGVQGNGLVATAVGDRLVLQSVASGAGETFTVTGGSALAGLGWSAGTTVSGHADAVDAGISGAYTGDTNRTLYFQPLSDGTVGTTAGLQVEVVDASGVPVATIDVGAGYTPGDEIELPDGIRVSLGAGELSATDGDVFALHAIVDADETDVLVALGLNTLFTGSDAAGIEVRGDILDDPDLLATAHTTAEGDAGNALALLALDTMPVATLGGSTLSERFAEIASGLGQEISAAESTQQAESLLLASLEARRDEISGVNVDEELVHMIEQEQAYAAASQFLRVVSELQNELLSII